MKKHCIKDDIQMANKHIRRYSTSLAIREIKIKTIIRYHHIPIRMAQIKKIAATPNAGKDVEKWDHSHIADENVKCYTHSGKQFGSFLKN